MTLESGIVGGVIAVGCVGAVIGLMVWSNLQAEKRQAAMRKTIIDTTRPTLQRPKPVPRRTVPPAWPVPERPSPPPRPLLDREEALEHHIAEGIAAVQFMLQKVWKQRGHDQ